MVSALAAGAQESSVTTRHGDNSKSSMSSRGLRDGNDIELMVAPPAAGSSAAPPLPGCRRRCRCFSKRPGAEAGCGCW